MKRQDVFFRGRERNASRIDGRAWLVLGIGAVGVFCLSLAVLGWSSDGPIARRVSGLPARLVGSLSDFTLLGTSGYMLWIAAMIGLAGALAVGRVQRPRRKAGFGLLAMRAAYFFVVVASSGILTQIIKHLVGRSRPKLIEQFGPFHFEPFSLQADLASFPSGHTTTAFAAATALGYFLPRWRGPLFLFALAIGLSRIAVGAHYTTDVFGGMIFGTLLAIAVMQLFARWDFVFRRADRRLRGQGLVRAALQAPR